MRMSTIDWIAWVLLMIGGLNWGLVGLFRIDVINLVLGTGIIADIIYTLVGVSALYMIYSIAVKKK